MGAAHTLRSVPHHLYDRIRPSALAAAERERARDRTVTPACRAAGTAYSNALRKQAAAKQKQASAKKALKNAKGKKAKARKAKALGRAKAKTKKANKAVAAALKARAKACASASAAIMGQRICQIQPNHPICRQVERRQEMRDRQNGVTPACRAAADKYGEQKHRASILKSGFPAWKKAIKNAKSDKAKKKAKKGYKKARKQHKKLAAPLPKLKAGYDSACAGARVKPPV